GDHRAGEGDRADQDPQIDLDHVDGVLGAGVGGRGDRIDVGGEAHQRCGQTHQRVHGGHQLGHLGHLHLPGGVEPYAAADEQGDDDPGDAAGGDVGAEYGGQHRQGHADDAVEVAAPGRLRMGEAAETQDEQDGGADVGDR